jgi:membrane protease YdiL (CAAX protease family)
VALAAICLLLSALLWLDGLVGSVDRPSVNHSLNIRQLELAAMAADGVPLPMRAPLFGEHPRQSLAEELENDIKDANPPATAEQRLELALLQRAAGETDLARVQLKDLARSVDEPRRPLLEALISGKTLDSSRQKELLRAWKAPTMVRQLACEQLGGPDKACPASRERSRLLLQLFGVNVVPVLMLIIGVVLLARQAWVLNRGLAVPAPPWQGPPFNLVDVTLLIAGGFVLLGEVVTPQLLQVPLQASLGRLSVPATVVQGLEVVSLYLALMLAPLLILQWLLRRSGHAPFGGWLQWHWPPLGSAVRQAITTLLMVLPLVALSGWLIDLIWPNPGGSNPLLELVLTSSNGLALALFAFTAIVLAPLFEEVLFRGVLLPVLGRRFGSVWGVLISAAVFALAHLSLSELVPLFLLGCGLGWLRWRSGRLAPSVLMHAFWNALTFANLLLLAD